MAVDNGAPIKTKYTNNKILFNQNKGLNTCVNVINEPIGNKSARGLVSINVIKYNIPIMT